MMNWRVVRSRVRVWITTRYMRPNNPLDRDKWRVVLALILAVTLWAWAMNNEFKEHAALHAEIERSYQDVVLGVMNGDVRMKVGDELFECKGGSIGKI